MKKMALENLPFMVVEVAVSTTWGGEHLGKVGGAISRCRDHYAEGPNLLFPSRSAQWTLTFHTYLRNREPIPDIRFFNRVTCAEEPISRATES